MMKGYSRMTAEYNTPMHRVGRATHAQKSKSKGPGKIGLSWNV